MGNGTTLSSNNTVWQKMIKNAHDRGLFFDVHEDKDLSNAVAKAIIELDDAENSMNMESMHISRPRFQVFRIALKYQSCREIKTKDDEFGYENAMASLVFDKTLTKDMSP